MASENSPTSEAALSTATNGSSTTAGWFITTDFFHSGGKVWQDWGPFPTQELALRVRELVEGMPINRSLNRTFFVDKRP